MSNIGRKDALNAASGFSAACSSMSFFCFMYLVLSWAAAAPKTPDPSHGLIFPHNEHGSITYFSAFQATSCALLFGASALFFLVALYLSPKKGVVRRTGKLGFSWNWQSDDPHNIQRLGMLAGVSTSLLFIFLPGPSIVIYLNSIGFVMGF